MMETDKELLARLMELYVNTCDEHRPELLKKIPDEIKSLVLEFAKYYESTIH